MQRKMLQVDTAYQIVRHITAVFRRRVCREFDKELLRTRHLREGLVTSVGLPEMPKPCGETFDADIATFLAGLGDSCAGGACSSADAGLDSEGIQVVGRNEDDGSHVCGGPCTGASSSDGRNDLSTSCAVALADVGVDVDAGCGMGGMGAMGGAICEMTHVRTSNRCTLHRRIL